MSKFLKDNFGDQFKQLESVINNEVIFCLIVLFQGRFGGLGTLNPPKAITKLVEGNGLSSALFRFLFVATTAYTASKGQVEFAIMATAIFFLVMYLLRTEEERKSLPYGF